MSQQNNNDEKCLCTKKIVALEKKIKALEERIELIMKVLKR